MPRDCAKAVQSRPESDGGLLWQVGIGGREVQDDVAFDDPHRRPGACLEAAEPHQDTSGISIGACSGA